MSVTFEIIVIGTEKLPWVDGANLSGETTVCSLFSKNLTRNTFFSFIYSKRVQEGPLSLTKTSHEILGRRKCLSLAIFIFSKDSSQKSVNGTKSLVSRGSCFFILSVAIGDILCTINFFRIICDCFLVPVLLAVTYFSNYFHWSLFVLFIFIFSILLLKWNLRKYYEKNSRCQTLINTLISLESNLWGKGSWICGFCLQESSWR